jgi:hypothetical protein
MNQAEFAKPDKLLDEGGEKDLGQAWQQPALILVGWAYLQAGWGDPRKKDEG